MALFEFTIIASGLDHNADDFEARFYDGGCEDSTVSFQKGHIIVDFAREAETVEDAIASAIEDVRATGATVDRVEPDSLVSLADIAARAGLTRAAITQYAKGQRGKQFPAPVARVTSESPLWNWAAVARWLHGIGRMPSERLFEAEAVDLANEAIEHRQPIRDTLKAGLQECRASL